MRFTLAILLSCFFSLSIFAQEQDRVEVSGKIIVKIDDLENVTIYNASSNKGTVTDSLGTFKIEVALNDEIKVSSVQLIPFKTKITQQVLDTKRLSIFLAERVNSLDEVVLLQYGLTGDIKTDIESTKVFDPLFFSFGSFDNFDLPDDYHSKVENTVVGSQNDRIRYQADGMAIIGYLVNTIFKSKNKKNKKRQDYKNKIGNEFNVPVSVLSESFPDEYFTKNYNIPQDRVLAFIGYLESESFNANLLNPKREIELIEYLGKKSEQFLKIKNEKE